MDCRKFEILETNSLKYCPLKSAELTGFDFYFQLFTGGANLHALDSDFVRDFPCGSARQPVIDQRRLDACFQLRRDGFRGGHTLLLAVKAKKPQLTLNNVEVGEINAHTDLAKRCVHFLRYFLSRLAGDVIVFGLFGQSKRPFAMISLSSFLLGLCSIAGGMLSPKAFRAFCIVVFVIGTTGMMGHIPYMAYIQKSVAAENLGKVISTITSIISIGIPLGMFMAGPIAEQVGVGTWMIGVGMILALTGSLSYLWTRQFDREQPAVESTK